MIRRPRRFALALALAAALPAGALLAPIGAKAADLSVRIEGLRSAKGVVSVCAAAKGDAFPDCSRVPATRKRTVPADTAGRPIVFEGLAPGTYAIAALHDENADGRLDTNLLGIPTEGIGISNDALPAFSAPRFRDAAVRLERSGTVPVRIRYR